MAETEAVSATVATTEATPEKRRGTRMSRPILPSAEPMKQKVSKLKEEISRRSERMAEIKGIQEKNRGGGRGAESRAVANELGEIRGQFNKLLNQKSALREHLQQGDKTRDQIRASAKQLKEKLQYTTVEEIDKQMRLLEHKLNYEDVGGVQNEKRIIENIKKLAESKKFVQTYSAKIAELEQGKDKRDETVQQLDKLNQELDALSAKEKSLRKQLDKERSERGKQELSKEDLNAEKQECFEVIKASRDRIAELQAEYNQQFEKYKADMEEYRKIQAEAKQERDAQYKAERDARDAQRKQREAELSGAPFSEHILRCDQLISYLSKYVTPEDMSKNAGAVESLSGERNSSSSEFAGMTMVKKKGEDEDDPLEGTLTKTKKSKKGKKGAKGANADKGATKKLLMDLDLITAFKLIDVRMPASTEECPELLQEVQAKKEEYKTKQKQAEENGGIIPAADNDDKQDQKEEEKKQDAEEQQQQQEEQTEDKQENNEQDIDVANQEKQEEKEEQEEVEEHQTEQIDKDNKDDEGVPQDSPNPDDQTTITQDVVTNLDDDQTQQQIINDTKTKDDDDDDNDDDQD
eukprot:TRINITY_DN842_c0_g1_i1.p1 TRINITY_DN842_c0_g1~~TRINITY_DN842_c0_g1_i1.p1  ORF type:complete len:662 (+),score=128.22 TRINITY_DN842_c0_g1_i1:252-1988(+)